MREFHTNAPNIGDQNGGKIIFPFGPCLYQNFVSDELRDSLLNEGKKIRNAEHKHDHKLAGNMRFGGSYTYSEEYRDKVFPDLLKILFQWFEFVNYHYGQKRVNFANGENLEVALTSLWVNFQKQYDHNPIHQHNGIVSFVIFLDVPEKIFETQTESNVKSAGHLLFRYGEAISPLCVNEWNVTPMNNLLLMFPATLDHLVYPFWVDEERISVSGNFVVTNHTVPSQNGIT